MAVPGKLLSQRYDSETSVLSVSFESEGEFGPPLFHIPEHAYPNGFTVTINGHEAYPRLDPETRRMLLPWNGMPGRRDVVVSPASE